MGVTKEKSEDMNILVVALWVRSTNACQRDTVDVNSRLRNFFLVQQTTRGCWNDEKWSNVLSRLQIKTAMGRLGKPLLYELSHFFCILENCRSNFKLGLYTSFRFLSTSFRSQLCIIFKYSENKLSFIVRALGYNPEVLELTYIICENMIFSLAFVMRRVFMCEPRIEVWWISCLPPH